MRRRAHRWLAVALPARLTQGWPWLQATSRILRPGHAAVAKLVDTATSMMGSPVADLPAGRARDAAAADLLSAASACLTEPPPSPPLPGRPRIDRPEIIRRSLDAIDSESVERPSVESLAAAAGVTERTLARAFRDTFGTSPLQYMLLRQLHAVRRGLRSSAGAATVSEVLIRQGVWDNGRFAARYRRQFGESPSATLTRAR